MNNSARTYSVTDAACGSSSSYLWRSFIWGRDIITAGYRWCIGDGSSVRVYDDQWIPWPSTFKVISPTSLGTMTTVADLKLFSGAWNEELIRNSFLPDDASLILSIPCSSGNLSDKMIWHYDKLGSYSVKSGYYIGLSLGTNPSPLGLNQAESWWKFLWRLKVPAKVKLLLWRACHNWVPSNDNLARRGVRVENACPICKRWHETTLHAMWCCPSLKSIRSMCPFMRSIKLADGMSFLDFMVACKKQIIVADMELLAMTIWRIWYRRNYMLHNVPTIIDDEMALWVTSFLTDFRQAKAAIATGIGISSTDVAAWCPPES
ncbi:hypothetical protein Dsin_004708 [Dipteronia sinensis]|uniref:Reverse transcriptase zinc-binding domain-containing protein n=1 Tax=Dipteronia sinensis TaxID=43782 RepID=A0AAE0AV26_9ROSI|nr:hypothetical protein Dsin_004708 [Dipteronia sinensis]